ncbi:type VII secretion protein EccB [Streptomyces sp.]|uniref:type VII secretion protein EccB n=1 Tax=Streptomyces sp. TaxID=1931 RepID=UPI002F422879
MQSKRDQVQAHMFLMGRLTSSMLRADPDAPESPQGRTNRGVAIGVVIALIVSAGAFVIGLMSPGKKDSWQSSGSLIVDRDTGSRFLYLDGRLRPVRNYASARLLGGAELKTTTVGTSSLGGTPHGPPVGIPGAPDVLPKRGDLADGPWQVCSSRDEPGSRVSTTLALGTAADGAGLGPQDGLLVSGPDSSLHLVWRGIRLRLDSKGGAAEALGYGSTAPVPVSAAFLNSLPAGPDLAPPEVPGRGENGPSLGGRATRIGQVFQVTAPGAQARYYLLRRDGLIPLSATTAALALGDPGTRREAYAGRPATALALGTAVLKGRLAPTDGGPEGPAELPASPPEPVGPDDGTAVCVRIQPDAQGPRLSVSLVVPGSLGPVAQPPAENLTPACSPADRVTVPPGGGALVRVLGAGGGLMGDTVYLVTDTGVKYRVPGADAAKALGYESVIPQALPSPLLSMLPTGPDLSPATAAYGKAVTTALRCAPVPGSPAATRR